MQEKTSFLIVQLLQCINNNVNNIAYTVWNKFVDHA